MATKLVTIIAYGGEWIRPEDLIKIRDYQDYVVEFLKDSPNEQRLKLYRFTYEVTDDQMLEDFALLEPVIYAQTIGDFTFSARQNMFNKLAIRRAMRASGNEAALDTLLANNEIFRKDWNDAIEIDLADPMVIQALALMQVDVDAVKVAIGNL